MRDVPKGLVAGYIHGAGLGHALVVAAASEQPYAPAAAAILDAILNPAITAIDLDDERYQQGVAALIGYGVIAQADADAIEALYQPPHGPLWELKSTQAIPGGWLVTITNGTSDESLTVLGVADPEGVIPSILAGRN